MTLDECHHAMNNDILVQCKIGPRNYTGHIERIYANRVRVRYTRDQSLDVPPSAISVCYPEKD